jgi:hypothetical protein
VSAQWVAPSIHWARRWLRLSQSTWGPDDDSRSHRRSGRQCPPVGKGDDDIGITAENNAYDGLDGVEPYTEKYDLVGIARLHPSALHCVVLADSPIQSIEDLRARKSRWALPEAAESRCRENARRVWHDL